MSIYWFALVLLGVGVGVGYYLGARQSAKAGTDTGTTSTVDLATDAVREQTEVLHAKFMAENDLRRAKREEYLKDHPLSLFYNTIDGVTAVMTPTHYDLLCEKTATARLDGVWLNEGVLLPEKCLFFLTVQGRERVLENYPGEDPKWYLETCFSGPRGVPSQLREFAEQNGVRLVQKPDIFVPFVSNRLASYDRQLELLGKHHYQELTLERASWHHFPEEMREIYFSYFVNNR